MLEGGLLEGEEATQGSVEKLSELQRQQAVGKRILGAVLLKLPQSSKPRNLSLLLTGYSASSVLFLTHLYLV